MGQLIFRHVGDCLEDLGRFQGLPIALGAKDVEAPGSEVKC